MTESKWLVTLAVKAQPNAKAADVIAAVMSNLDLTGQYDPDVVHVAAEPCAEYHAEAVPGVRP